MEGTLSTVVGHRLGRQEVLGLISATSIYRYTVEDGVKYFHLRPSIKPKTTCMQSMCSPTEQKPFPGCITPQSLIMALQGPQAMDFCH